MWRSIGLGALLVAFAMTAGWAAEVDPHRTYESKCKLCHFEHAADLARLNLKIEKDSLVVGHTGQPLSRFFGKHHGVVLLPDELAALTLLFTNGLKWNGVFQHRCFRCHKRAADFARNSLEIRDGAVVVKNSGKGAAELLSSHGEATPEEALTLMEMLRYQLETAPKSAK